MNPIKAYLWFPGRMKPFPYLIYGVLIPAGLMFYLLSYILDNGFHVPEENRELFVFGSISFLKFFIPLLIVAPAIKRFHDIDVSGLYVLSFLIPLIGIFIWLGLVVIPSSKKKESSSYNGEGAT